MDELFAFGLAAALTLAIPLACVAFPSLVPPDRINQEGHRYFIDIQAFKIGLGVGVVLLVGSAIAQGEASLSILLIVFPLAIALALFMGVLAHLIYRRQQSRHRRPALRP